MSGPKSSRYTLTPAQRRALMISRQKHLVQQERIHLSALLAQIENDSHSIQAHANETAKAAVANVSQLIQQYFPLLSGELPDELDSLIKQRNTLQSARQAVSRTQRALNQKARETEVSWKKQIAQDLTKGFGVTLDSALEVKQDQKQQEHQKRMMQLEQIIVNAVRNETAAQAKKFLTQYQQNGTEAFRNTLFITSIQPLIKQHQSEMEQYLLEEADYQQLLFQYADLCEELSITPEPQPWSPSAMKALRTKVDQMEQLLQQQEEEAYICQALDEVMQDMGYSLLGDRDVTKRSGKKFHHTLYAFEDGTAIDVTYSDDGQIAMELGGLDSQDRIPDHQETVYLCEAMEGFCTSFAQIEERLKHKGIVLRERIHMLPPSEENAQIINTSDYQLSAAPSMLDISHQAAGNQGKKQMYRDEE